jgi:hypothetical protein
MTPSADAAHAPPLHELEHLQLLKDYADSEAWMARMFTSRSSLRWFLRQHGDELAEDGALLKLRNGRNAVHRVKFPRAVSRILGVPLQATA